MIQWDYHSRALFVPFIVGLCGLCIAVLQPSLFTPYFGAMPLVIGLISIYLFGLVALYYLSAHGYFALTRPQSRRRGVIVAAGLTVPFAIVVTGVDLSIGFPRNINVASPTALVFYPVMGLVLVLLLHAVPLAFLMWFLRRVIRLSSVRFCIVVSVVSVALLEPIFQFAFASTELAVFVAIHVFLFGVVEMIIFRRYDFVAMYVFRIVYYAYWHILWGQARLLWLY